MSDVANFLFKSNNVLTKHEEQKNEITQLTDVILQAKGIECDSRIPKISQQQLKGILEDNFAERRIKIEFEIVIR